MTTAEAPVKYDYDRIPYLVAFQNNSGVRDIYGGVAELVVLESYLLKPKDKPSDTVLVFMHPIGGGAYLPMINALARARPSRHLLQQPVPRHRLRAADGEGRRGPRRVHQGRQEPARLSKVVLAGWSGGGSLSVFYQQQAQNPTVTASPSGDGPDLTKLGLIPADGIMLLAAHISRHGTLTEWMDASILDESDPAKRDPELDLYNPDNPNQPPYTEEFLERYRAGADRPQPANHQVGQGKTGRAQGRGSARRRVRFVVHGTMADPRWLDPDGRPERTRPGHLTYLGDPQVVNNSPVGLARFCTLRSWLSQWSYDDANGDAVKCGPDIAVPALVIGNLADDACTPSHTRRLFEAIGHPDKEMHEIPGANHYYSGPDQRETLRRGRRHLHGLAAPARVLRT